MERITLRRSFNGRNFLGILSHVLRPMITAFRREEPGMTFLPRSFVVIFLKCAISYGNCHGIV